jgi:hypothetical protein
MYLEQSSILQILDKMDREMERAEGIQNFSRKIWRVYLGDLDVDGRILKSEPAN